jgi:exopolyphosphatase/guanosine-5'-triphosphate,3'-diphosphate pyrophosphatase
MKVAAVDLGSNSLHLLVVEVGRHGELRVLGREKEMVRLGEGAFGARKLSAAATERAMAALRKFRRMIDAHRVEATLGVATAAVREAKNGERFLERIGRELDFWPRAISGEEEARLVYLAAQNSLHLDGREALVVDVGGGSVELALGTGQELRWTASAKLGVLRLAEQFVRSDPLEATDERRMVRHVDHALAAHGAHLREGTFDCVVGTSGTILALGALALRMEGRDSPDTLHHVVVRADTIHALRRWLVAADARARRELPGLERRADIIVPGAILLDTLLQRVKASELVLCEWALREGLLVDFVRGHASYIAAVETEPDLRRRSVVALAERCRFDAAHGRQVAEVALALFDQTRHRHGLGARERGLLEYAALLHDIGHHISYVRHHKHTYYLIRNGELRGFEPAEIELIATVARYHRRRPPTRKHAPFAALPEASRRVVKVLAAQLRLADALDRSHRQVVRKLTVVARGEAGMRLDLEVDGDSELELWGAERRKAAVEAVLGASLEIEAHPAPDTETVARERSKTA